jgi:hypothetical protein
MAKRALPPGQLADEMSSGRPEKMARLSDDMPERLRDIVNKKHSLLEQIWKDSRNMIQYERSYLTACSYGNVLRGMQVASAVYKLAVVSCSSAVTTLWLFW